MSEHNTKQTLEFIRNLEPPFVDAIAQGRITVSKLMELDSLLKPIARILRDELRKRDDRIHQLEERCAQLESVITKEMERA